jgi:uncharacterized protein YpmB
MFKMGYADDPKAFVVEALNNGGYTTEFAEVKSAVYKGCTEKGSVVFEVFYPSEDGPGLDSGYVYVTFEDGKWTADF